MVEGNRLLLPFYRSQNIRPETLSQEDFVSLTDTLWEHLPFVWTLIKQTFEKVITVGIRCLFKYLPGF